MKLHRDVLTTGDVARALCVSPHTVTKWCNRGILPSYRLPAPSRDRRIHLEDLQAFARQHGMRLPRLMRPDAERVVILLSSEPDVTAQLHGVTVVRAQDLFDLGRCVEVAGPELHCVVIDLATAGSTDGLRAARALAGQRVPVVVLAWDRIEAMEGVQVVEMPGGLMGLAGVIEGVSQPALD